MRPLDFARHVVANYGAFEPDVVVLAKLAIKQFEELVDASSTGDAYRDGYRDGANGRSDEIVEQLQARIRELEQQIEDTKMSKVFIDD